MTRKIWALLATLALVAAVAVGCGGGTDNGMAPGQETTQPTTGETQPGATAPGSGN